ncbi:MAG: site-specific DNA-methyltransferase [Aquabacterium sp.]|nr:site-specific DNA-methyltransferase [Aquabacterium sp.]
MPEIVFKGKEYVYNHHLTVPYRPLVPQPDKSIGAGHLDGNLIIHGDNLHALKSLLPRYAGAVDLIFIDPPYNTGNEGWCYSDAVNSPIMKEWLSTNPVDGEDMLRHDKWLCMMWPRLVLLRELLSEQGSIWITLDDNEVHRARMVLDELFGTDRCVGQIAWQKRTSRENRAALSPSIDHLLVYAKCSRDDWKSVRQLLPATDDNYGNPDNDPRGPWASVPFSAQGSRPNQQYPITTPTGKKLAPPKGRCWAATEPEFIRLRDIEHRVYWPKGGDGLPRIKQFRDEAKGLVPDTLWLAEDVGDTESSKKHLLQMFAEREDVGLHAPKPVALIERIVDIASSKDALILDSFAGSGTTAHAVLKANARDGGTRRFILVEGEDYADRLTAERVRRAINGYAWVGTQREELLKEKITWTQFKKADQWLQKVAAIQAAEGFGHEGTDPQQPRRFDKINVRLDDGVLLVEGERRVSERAPGLGGSFTFCTLGEPVSLEQLLSGERLPGFDALGAWLFYTATGATLPPRAAESQQALPPWYLGETASRHVWLVYRPELAFLKSPEAALTLGLAQQIAEWGRARGDGKGHLVFAPAKYLSNRQLLEHGLEFAALPFALYREA